MANDNIEILPEDYVNSTLLVGRHARSHNSVGSVLNRIKAALGAGFLGGFATLAARLSDMESRINSLKITLQDLTVPQPIPDPTLVHYSDLQNEVYYPLRLYAEEQAEHILNPLVSAQLTQVNQLFVGYSLINDSRQSILPVHAEIPQSSGDFSEIRLYVSNPTVYYSGRISFTWFVNNYPVGQYRAFIGGKVSDVAPLGVEVTKNTLPEGMTIGIFSQVSADNVGPYTYTNPLRDTMLFVKGAPSAGILVGEVDFVRHHAPGEAPGYSSQAVFPDYGPSYVTQS